MNERCSKIISLLAAGERVYHLRDLAAAFSCSERTIRNDLAKINEELAARSLPPIAIERGGRLRADARLKEAREMLLSGDFYDYKLSKQERILLAAEMFTAADSFITLEQVAEYLVVSRSTIIGDLGEIKAFLWQHGLKLLSYANKGLRVEGEEGIRRLLLVKLFAKTRQSPLQSALWGDKEWLDERLTVIPKILREKENACHCVLSDDSFRDITRYLIVALQRIASGHVILHYPEGAGGKAALARDVAELVSQYYEVTLRQPEISFLADQLEKAHYLADPAGDEEAVRVQLLTRRFIAAIAAELSVPITRDYEFFENLANHLTMTLRQTSFTEKTPAEAVLRELAQSHPAVEQVVRRHRGILEAYAGRDLSPREIDYIMVHVCTAIERAKVREHPPAVIVVCNAGIGTSQLLCSKLRRYFHFQGLDVVVPYQLKDIPKDAYDFIITTVPLPEEAGDAVLVTPLLSNEDFLKIANKLEEVQKRGIRRRKPLRELSASGLLEALTPVLAECFPEAAEEDLRKVRRAVRLYFSREQEKPLHVMLHNLLTPLTIRLDVACDTWQDAVRASAQTLLDLGYIRQSYVEGMIGNIERNGPYIVLAPGFALPHESPQLGSLKMGMSLIRLQRPVAFGSPAFDPVEFVCCLATVDRKSHLTAMFTLINLIQDEAFRAKLRQAKTPEEAARIIEYSDWH